MRAGWFARVCLLGSGCGAPSSFELCNSFANRLFAFDEQGLHDFRGTYEEYAAKRDGGGKRNRR